MADRIETIGIYSAYGFAKEAGYTGTKAEFEQGLKNSAEYADNAASSANAATNAKNAAVTAKKDAQAAQSAAETAQGLAEDAQAAAEEAKNDAEAAAASLDASTIARIDGFYENMGVGTADQLMASQKVNDSDPYIFRTSGGTSDIGNREELEIVGGSVVWNQLVQNGNFTDISAWDIVGTGTSYTVENNIATVNHVGVTSFIYQPISCIANHKYFITVDVRSDVETEAILYWDGGSLSTHRRISSDWQTITRLYNGAGTGINLSIRPNAGEGNTSQLKNFMLLDLTAMFGSEIADHIYELEQAEAGAGVAWFRKYFPNDYYDYNPGELTHVTDLQSHDTVGFNLLEDSVTVGYRYTDGVYTSATAKYAASSIFSVLPNTKYCFSFPSLSKASAIYIVMFDNNKNHIKSTDYIGIPNATKRVLHTAESDTRYMAFYLYSNDTLISSDFDNACVNISWSGTRDGEYEPYDKHSYPLDPSLTLRGIPKLTADGDLTYDGDVYKPDGTVERRYRIVDLGTLNWGTRATGDTHKSLYAQLPYPYNGYPRGNVSILSDAYVASDTGYYSGANDPKIINPDNSAIGFLYFSSSGTPRASVLNLIVGINDEPAGHLIYTLAEPTTEQAEPYTSPQIVDDWGTEGFVTTSIVPVGHNTSYPANLRDKLQHLPDLPDDDGYYMTQVTGTQMSLIRFRIPQAPAEDGEYILKATVSNGTPTYTWEAVVEAEGGEG